MMQEAGGKLAVDRHLTHLVRGGRPPTGDGNVFLVIEDPTQDLCTPKADPDGQCAAHLRELKQLVEQQGYVLNPIKTSNATVPHVLRALADPAVVGLYYFGHGFFPPNADQGCLLLADGPLYAGEIEDLGPGIRFVFLNACDAGAPGQNWTLEKKFRSVGHTFARGGPMKTVIAPLWPVLNVQAAQASIEFFRSAMAGRCLGDALREVRKSSLQRYEQGQPDISWMAYRYFGDPNRVLPSARQSSPVSSPGAALSRLFREEEKLDMDLFGFDVRDVLLRAAKRRNLQGRALVSVADVLAGLVRTGHLTRLAMRQLGFDPDDTYRKMVEEKEEGPPCPPSAVAEEIPEADGAERQSPSEAKLAALRVLLQRWIVRTREQFDAKLVGLLECADHGAQARSSAGGDSRITEQDVLEAFLPQSRWAAGLRAPLPPAGAMADWLHRRAESQTVDANGRLILDRLSPPARRIVEAAHEFAQQRGICPIPSHLTLAAFLKDRDSVAAHLCRRSGVRARLLALMLIASTEGKSPETFSLSPESADGVVLPMLQRAASLEQPEGQEKISEATLFRAFCDVTPQEFKAAMRSLPKPVPWRPAGKSQWGRSISPGWPGRASWFPSSAVAMRSAPCSGYSTRARIRSC